MLVLTRKSDESIILHTSDGPIKIKTVRIKGSTVRIGVEAPEHVQIVREEIDVEAPVDVG